MTISIEEVFGDDRPLETLVNELDGVFPIVTPIPGDNVDLLMYRAGQRSVIDYLQNKLNNPED